MSLKFDPETRSLKVVTLSENLYDFFCSKGFFFSKEVLTRYYLSLKTKPIVILSGISGTGKTKIAQLFAEYMCQDDQKEDVCRTAFLSVRPDWMDNKGLLGYYNILDEKYHSTRLLDLLLDAIAHPEKPFFVILDEMNLAKVEHYFSDFLSILESRTPDKPAGETITLHQLEEARTIDGRNIPGAIHVPANVFFAGTVNIDESTYMFSPKVLDRTNVIEFNEVDLEAYAGRTGEKGEVFPLQSGEVLERFYEGGSSAPFCKKEDYLGVDGQVKKYLEGLHAILKKYNLHFGYRVANEVGKFITLAVAEVGEACLNDAVDIQIIQKILPKLHGTRAKLEEPLQQLLAFCHDGSSSFSEELTNKVLSPDHDFRFPRSGQKISRMLSQLAIQGYASFVE